MSYLTLANESEILTEKKYLDTEKKNAKSNYY